MKTRHSECTEAVNYQQKHGVLTVTFQSGTVYEYYGVPKVLWRVLQNVVDMQLSVGKFLNEHIKNEFPYKKIG